MSVDPISERYARALQMLVLVGIGLLLVGFVLYITGAVPSAIPPEKVTTLWQLDSDTYVKETGQPTDWGWVRGILTGQGIAFASLVYLSLCTIVCLLLILPRYLRAGDRRYAIIVILQIAVLVAAASGILSFR